MKKGKLICFEGMDFSGKSTQVRKAIEYLEEKGEDVVSFREPGGTQVGEQIREILLHQKKEPITELFLFTAARMEIIETKIIPALQEGKIVIMDRFIDSTMVYQGYGRDLMTEVSTLERMFIYNALNGYLPDMTFYLNITPEEAQKRYALRDIGKPDVFENENLAFKKKLYHGYLEVQKFRKKQGTIVVPIDASQEIDKVWENVKSCLDVITMK